MTMEIPEEESSATSDYKSGVVSKALNVGKVTADSVFYAASKSTSAGVGIARSALITSVSG